MKGIIFVYAVAILAFIAINDSNNDFKEQSKAAHAAGKPLCVWRYEQGIDGLNRGCPELWKDKHFDGPLAW